jgi:hypothetical protein
VASHLAPAERRVVRLLGALCVFAVLWHLLAGLRPPPPPLVLERDALHPSDPIPDSVLYTHRPPAVHQPGPDHPLDLLTAAVDSLELIPGIGPVLARRIAAWRAGRTDSTEVDDLIEVRGIGPVLLDRIRPFLKGGGS